MEEKIIKPISPNEIMENLDKIIPRQIIESVNEFLKERFRNTSSVKITKDELISRIQTKMDISRNELINKNMLDFEKLYRDNGWDVLFNSPDRDENFDQYFLFSKKK